jgi:hypothetical protein
MRKVVLSTLIRMIALAGCSPGGTRLPAPPSRSSPPITLDQLDVSKYASKPCTLTDPDKLTQRGLSSPGTPGNGTCTWTATARAFILRRPDRHHIGRVGGSLPPQTGLFPAHHDRRLPGSGHRPQRPGPRPLHDRHRCRRWLAGQYHRERSCCRRGARHLRRRRDVRHQPPRQHQEGVTVSGHWTARAAESG